MEEQREGKGETARKKVEKVCQLAAGPPRNNPSNDVQKSRK